MSDLKFRQKYGIDPLREWIRKEMPTPDKGFVASDIDLAIRRYGNNYQLDADGDLMLIEKKEYVGKSTQAQIRIMGWLDSRIKDEKWRGFHVIKIVYPREPNRCCTCGCPVETDKEAHERFKEAEISYDGDIVTHDQLKFILDGKTTKENREIYKKMRAKSSESDWLYPM